MRGRNIFMLVAVAALAALPAPQALVLNEIFYDSAGADVGTFTEILGTPGMALDGYSLVGVNGSDGGEYRTVLLDGMMIPDDGRLVIGQDNTVPNYDYIDTGMDWQNGPDEVELRYNGEVIDAICYGYAETLACEGGTNGPDVASGNSIARCPDGHDTDNNENDTEEVLPTPGETNACPNMPVDMTWCEATAKDANGVPIHEGELVHITDALLVLNDDPTFSTGYLDAAVTDGSCCGYIFDFNLNPGLMAGDLVDVTGTVLNYHEKLEITSPGMVVNLISSGNPLPDPTPITTQDLALNCETYEGCLISLCGLTIVSGTWPVEGENASIQVMDASGAVIVLRIDRDTDIDGSPEPDQPFRCIGVGGQYDADVQILPRGSMDIEGGIPSPAIESTWGNVKSIFK